MWKIKVLTIPNRLAARIKLAVFDFDGVFTDNTVWVSKNGQEAVRCWRGDGLGINRLKGLDVEVWVLSTEADPVVKTRCKKLQIQCQTGLKNKRIALEKLLKKLTISSKETMYVGNDINDVDCLEMVGLPVVVSDATGETKAVAKYITQRPGGLGVVREVCDWIVACKNYQKKK